jgi:hypothetical protein
MRCVGKREGVSAMKGVTVVNVGSGSVDLPVQQQF